MPLLVALNSYLLIVFSVTVPCMLECKVWFDLCQLSICFVFSVLSFVLKVHTTDVVFLVLFSLYC